IIRITACPMTDGDRDGAATMRRKPPEPTPRPRRMAATGGTSEWPIAESERAMATGPASERMSMARAATARGVMSTALDMKTPLPLRAAATATAGAGIGRANSAILQHRDMNPTVIGGPIRTHGKAAVTAVSLTAPEMRYALGSGTRRHGTGARRITAAAAQKTIRGQTNAYA